MQLHNLKRKTANKTSKRVGRGGKRGKTSGRGTKGQKARAGHRIRPEFRDMIQKLPKRRGYGKHRADSINDNRVKPFPVNLAVLEAVFNAGDAVTPQTLVAKKVLRAREGNNPIVKILGTGVLTKKLLVSGVTVSSTARASIEKAGGSVA